MNHPMILQRLQSFVIIILLLIIGQLMVREVAGHTAQPLNTTNIALDTEFSYQGNLAVDEEAANGEYDFQFRLYDAETGGTQIAATKTTDNTPVQGGIFSVYLDFGDVFNGRGRWLQISVREGDSDGNYTTLFPRQEIHPVPYALYAESALETWEFNSLVTTSFSGAIEGAAPYAYESTLHSPIINVIKAPMIAKQIEAISIVMARRNGAYEGNFTVDFSVYDFAGNLLHTANAVPVDLEAVPIKEIVTVELSGTAENLVVRPGEHLAVTVRRSGDAGGNLGVNFMAQVLVRNALQGPGASNE